MNDSDKKMITRVAKWVAVTYGIKAIDDIVMNFQKYMDAYNEAMAECIAKLQKNEGLRNQLAAQVYAEIRGE